MAADVSATHMHGYLSRDGLPPSELLTRGREEVQHHGGEILDGTVTRPGRGRHQRVPCRPHRRQLISGRRLLITTGSRDELPDLPGLNERWARDVLHCPYCHGHEVRDRRLGVIGGTAGSGRYAQIVRHRSEPSWPFTFMFVRQEGTAATDAATLGIIGVATMDLVMSRLAQVATATGDQ